MKRYIHCLILTLSTICFNVSAQSYLKFANSDAYEHHLSFADHQVSFSILSSDVKPGKAKLGHPYYWLSGSQINVTNGGYSGKLLHGDYTSFFLNKQLKEQGNFKKGLKEGDWKQWREDGSLVAKTSFRKGLENGRFTRYDEKGLLTEEGSYLNGKLNGKLRKVVGTDSVVISKYRNGVAIQDTSVSWWKFWKKRK